MPAIGVPFNQKLVSGHHGQPGGWYLDVHRFGEADLNHPSTWVLLHAPGNLSWVGEWVLEPQAHNLLWRAGAAYRWGHGTQRFGLEAVRNGHVARAYSLTWKVVDRHVTQQSCPT